MTLMRMRPTGRPKVCLLALLILALLGVESSRAQNDTGKPTETGREKPEESAVFAPLFGWGHDRSSRFHYVVPLYYHQADASKDDDLTLLFPLLTVSYSGRIGEVRVRETASLPLLALIGTLEWDRRKIKGYLSPYLAAGYFRWNKDPFSAGASGASILPWIPYLGDFLSLRLSSSSYAGDRLGRFTYADGLYLPGFDIGLYEYRTAGIEKDFSLLTFWDLSLYRSRLDLPGMGFDPDLQQLHTSRILNYIVPPGGKEGDPLEALAEDLSSRLAEARSGNPVEHVGVADPMIVYELRGEDLSALGIEPLFYYDMDEGFSLPLLLTTLKDGGLKFGEPALRHLFPLLHGNREGTRYDFLLNLGTLYLLEGYTALDLKLLFNLQRDASKGYAWGLLPFPFGKTPAPEIREDLRFVQLRGHAISQWRYDRRFGIEVLPPFLFSYTTRPEEDALRFLLFFGYAVRGPERRDVEHSALLYAYRRHDDGRVDFGLLPFNLLFDYEEHRSGGFEHSSIWSLLHSYENIPSEIAGGGLSRTRALTLGPLGLLFDYERRDDSRLEHATLWTLLHDYESRTFTINDVSRKERDFSLGPFGLLFDGHWESGVSSAFRVLLLFGFKKDEERFEFNILGLPIFSIR